MASKKSASTEKDLKKSVKKLRAQVVRAEAKADKWKKKATKLEKSATRSDAQAKKLEKASSPVVAPIPAIAEPTEPAVTTDSTESGPNEGWTVVQLRAEARSRGLTGLSGKSKAQLLQALS